MRRLQDAQGSASMRPVFPFLRGTSSSARDRTLCRCRSRAPAATPRSRQVRDDIRGEIDFVMRRANARAELDDESSAALPNCSFIASMASPAMPSSVPLLPGVHQTDAAADRIDEINRAAVGDVNPEADARLVGDQPVAAVKALILRRAAAHNTNNVAMNLLGR